MATRNLTPLASVIRKLREDSGLTLEKFSQKSHISTSTAHTWERGVTVPKGKNLAKLLRFYGISEEELRRMEAVSENTKPSTEVFRKIPVVSWTTAGHAHSYEDLANQIDELVDTSTKDPNAFAIEVVGDSMEKEIFAGDRIVLEPNREASNGDLAYVRFTDEAGGGGTLKWFYRTGPEGAHIKLVAENENYKPIEAPVQSVLFAYPVINIVRRVQKRRRP